MAPPVTLSAEEVRAVEDGVRGALKDPDSAQFGPYKAARSTQVSGAIVVCGTVNARNSFGGYTGHLPYGGLLAELADGKVRVFKPFGFAKPGKDGDIGIFLVCRKHGVNIDG